nr:MAG TPA: hypothetical protein [Caudoviricetes sp.]
MALSLHTMMISMQKRTICASCTILGAQFRHVN